MAELNILLRRRVAVAALAALLTGCSPDKPHVVLISLDTTRADHLGCYGRPGKATPHLDALAEKAVRFADVTTAAPTTLASHTSILTGLYPHTHGVPENGFKINRENVMLAEVLSEKGYRTAAFLGSFALSKLFGTDQGFDHFDEDFNLLVHPKEYDQNQRRAARVTDAVLDYVDRPEDRSSRPQFLFAHYFDPHAPYDPPPPFSPSGAAPRPDLDEVREATRQHQVAVLGEGAGLRSVYTGLTRELLDNTPGKPLPVDAGLSARYGAEVSYLDAEVGRLLNGLAERGLLDHAIVAVFADHGETHWEHADFYNHGLALYETTVRVPLLLRLPNEQHAGTVVDTPVSTLDLLPTLLELLGLPIPPRLEGKSLIAAFAGGAFERGPVFTSATHPAGDDFHPRQLRWRNHLKARAVRDGRWKLILTPYLNYWELYDLEKDPGERHNLLSEPTPEIEALAGRLAGQLKEWNASADPLPAVPSKQHREDVRKRLEALGYL